MRTTKAPKLAAQRLAEALPRVTLDGRQIVLDGEHRFSDKHAWIENLGILADLAACAGWTSAQAWEACRYQPTAGRQGLVVRDRGWTSLAVRWLLKGHPDLNPAPLS
jgi:hypothetical protein